MSLHEKYRSVLASYLGVQEEQVSLYWKGRVALYSVLKAMEIGPGDEVILPGFTCVVVPNAVMYLGATPVYVDINPSTLCCDTASIEQALTPKTKAILIQNMLGLSDQVDEIVAIAKKKGIYTIEDCTHGFGGSYRGILNGLRSDASFFSSQWNKPFSTGIGGMLVLNNLQLIPTVELVTAHLTKPGRKDRLVLWVLLWARTYLLKGFTYWTLLRTYRWLSKKGLVVGSSSAIELQGTTMPTDYFKGMSSIQCRAGIKAVSQLEDILLRRKQNALKVHQWLIKNEKNRIPDDFLQQHAFLKYPLMVKNRDQFLQIAENNRLPMGDWFISPLHPIKESLLPWGLDTGKLPNATAISQKIVNLPLDGPVSRLINFLELYKKEIE